MWLMLTDTQAYFDSELNTLWKIVQYRPQKPLDVTDAD
jgi:hypothetical protein